MALAKPPRPHGLARRPSKVLIESLSQEALLRAAEAAHYVSSAYHRAPGSRLGRPLNRPYPHASRCPNSWDLAAATRALKAAIRAGRVSAEWRGDFPRYAWHVDGETVYEAVLSNRQAGDYHAYPLESRAEWPKGL
jgi:hypothetical protein